MPVTHKQCKPAGNLDGRPILIGLDGFDPSVQYGFRGWRSNAMRNQDIKGVFVTLSIRLVAMEHATCRANIMIVTLCFFFGLTLHRFENSCQTKAVVGARNQWQRKQTQA